MTFRTLVLLAAWSLSARCFAQTWERPADAALTGEQWQQRVEDARRRSQEYVANARTRPPDATPATKGDVEAADQRATDDPSLKRGDIIVTSNGYLVFVGRDLQDRQPSDFLPISKSQNPPSKLR